MAFRVIAPPLHRLPGKARRLATDLTNKQVGPMGRTGGQHAYGFLAGNVIASPRDDTQFLAAAASNAPNQRR